MHKSCEIDLGKGQTFLLLKINTITEFGFKSLMKEF